MKSAARSATDSAASTAGGLGDAIGDKAGELGRKTRGIAADAIDQGHALTDQATAKAGDLYGRAKDQVNDLSERLPNASEAYRAGQRAYTQGSEHVGRRVSKQPIEALLLAGAIGYLVGWATSRS